MRRALMRLREDLDAIAARDPACRSRVDALVNYPGVHALWAHRVAHRLWNASHPRTARLLSTVTRIVTAVDIHPAARLGRRVFIDHGAGVVIGETAVIGDDVTLYQGVTLGGTRLHPGRRHPTLEDGVTVGAGAKVLGAVTLRAGCQVGANAVVVRDVPARAVVVGVPGQIVNRASGQHDPDDVQHTASVDPSGAALEQLLVRVAWLESRLAPPPDGSAPLDGSAPSDDSAPDPALVHAATARPPIHAPVDGVWREEDFVI